MRIDIATAPIIREDLCRPLPPGALPCTSALVDTPAQALPFEGCTSELPPGHLLARLRERIEGRQQAIRDAFEHGTLTHVDAPDAGLGHSRMVDELLSHLLDLAAARVQARNEGGEAPLAVLAIGEHGRGTLAPHSIPEIAMVLDPARRSQAAPMIDYLLSTLWDLGVRVHHRAHTVAEWIERVRESQRCRTAMLDARMLWGHPDLYRTLRHRFESSVIDPSRARWLAEIWEQQNRRHQGFGNGLDADAPHVVDGAGGLRDLDTLVWLTRLQHSRVDQLAASDQETFVRSRRFLMTVRCHIHYLCSREHDRLEPVLQPEIAARMGYVASTRTATAQLMDDYRKVTVAVSRLGQASRYVH